MKKHMIATMAIILYAVSLYGQTNKFEEETWAEKPAIYKPGTEHEKESAVIVFDKRRIEYMLEGKDELISYYTSHRIIHVNDDRGIETFNKIYLGVTENSDLLAVKARTIMPDGKIIELNKSDIKDIKEDGNTYKIFALDGLRTGCDIEYFYTFKKDVSFFGRENVQSNYPILKTLFQVIMPEHLRFEIKGYNCTAATTDSLVGTKRIMQCVFTGIPGIEDEKYAFRDVNVKRVEYKLSYNDADRKGERLFTWNELAKRAFGMYTYVTDKEQKKVQELIQANGWDKLSGDVNKIVAVENFIKKNYSYNEEANTEEAVKVETVLRNKIGGTMGFTRLYSAVFTNLGVKHQIVLAADRSKTLIDPTLENWNSCDQPLFYFSATNKYIAPTRPDYRYPLIYPLWGGTNGLFLKGTSIGTFVTAIAEVKPIELEDYTRSFSNIESKLELTRDLDSLNIDARQIYGGYNAVAYKGMFNFANDEQQKLFIKEMAKQVASTDNILFSEAVNKDFETTDKPFVLHTKTRATDLIERAGNKLLLKIGMAIGMQVQMYQEKPRQQPVDMEFGNVQNRKIEFVIPDGYVIKNLNDLNLSQNYLENGVPTMGFHSSYELKGNLLTVTINEEYRNAIYPLSIIDPFIKIINTSSDFNKIVLVLEKKG